MHALPGLAYYRQGWTGVVIPGSDTEPLEAAISARGRRSLTEAQRSTIVAAVSATGTVIDVAGQKVEFQVGLGRRFELSYTGAHSHKYAQIGDEIVVYTGTTLPVGDNIRLTGVVRGVYRTPTSRPTRRARRSARWRRGGASTRSSGTSAWSASPRGRWRARSTASA